MIDTLDITRLRPEDFRTSLWISLHTNAGEVMQPRVEVSWGRVPVDITLRVKYAEVLGFCIYDLETGGEPVANGLFNNRPLDVHIGDTVSMVIHWPS